MPPLTIAQIRAPDLSVASQATARAGESFQRAASSASDLLGKYQEGLEAKGDAELTNLLAGAKNEEEWNNVLASTDFSKLNLSAGMRDNILNRRDNVLGYERSRADTGLVGAQTDNTNATAANTRNSTRINTNRDNRDQTSFDRNIAVEDQRAGIAGMVFDGTNEGLTYGNSNPNQGRNFGPRADGSGINAPASKGMEGRFMSAVQAGGITNPFGLAAIAATGRHESGFSAENGNRTWSDPSETGRPGTAGGYMSWNNDRLGAMNKFTGGDTSPEAQAKFLLSEDPDLMRKLNNAQSVEEATKLMNDAWRFAGYNREGGEAAARLNTARSLVGNYSGGRTPNMINPNRPRDNTARSALAAAAASPNNVLPYTEWQGILGSQYDAATTGQAAITAEDQRQAQEFAAAQRLAIADSPDVTTSTEAIVAQQQMPQGATAVEREQNRAALLTSVSPGGVLAASILAGTDEDPEVNAVAEGMLRERAAIVERSPSLQAAVGAAQFEKSPAESLVTALKDLNAEGTIPADLRGKIRDLATSLEISEGEAAYSMARAAESAWNQNFIVGVDGFLTLFGDGIPNKDAKKFASENFRGDRSQENRQKVRDFETQDREVLKLKDAVQTARARAQKSAKSNNGVVEPKYKKAYETAAALLDKAVQDSIIPSDEDRKIPRNEFLTTPMTKQDNSAAMNIQKYLDSTR